MNSLLYERLANSRDRVRLMRLAAHGQEVRTPADVLKDTLVPEFVGVPQSPRLVGSELVQAIIDSLQAFHLEPSKGFAFLGRQHAWGRPAYHTEPHRGRAEVTAQLVLD